MYESPNSSVRREADAITVAGATTEGAKFRSFQKMILRKAHCAAIVAGTVSGHGYDVYNGTTSVGTMVLGIGAAGTLAHSGLLNSAVASMGQISVKSLADATGVAHIVFEYDVDNDAVQTAPAQGGIAG